VFNLKQTPIANRRTLFAIEPLSQGDRAFNSTYSPEPSRVSVVSLRNMSGERKYHASAFNPAGDSLKRLLQGAAAGAVATMFVGFYWGGWTPWIGVTLRPWRFWGTA